MYIKIIIILERTAKFGVDNDFRIDEFSGIRFNGIL
jgi:hypothetical protein